MIPRPIVISMRRACFAASAAMAVSLPALALAQEQVPSHEIVELSQYISWLLPPIAVLIAIAFYLSFVISAIGTVGTSRQLKRRIEAEKRFRLLWAAVEQSSEGMAICDIQSRILFSNRAFAAMHGCTVPDMMGRDIRTFHLPDQLPDVERAMGSLTKQGFFSGEVWHVRKDGSPFPAFMNNSLIRADDGRPMGVIGTMRDISREKEDERRLKEYSDQLEHMVEERTKELDRVRANLFASAKLAAMGRMSAGVAHQLNSPLCGALLMVDSLIDESGEDAERRKKLMAMRGALEGMRDVIECMLALAMVGRRGEPADTDVDINEVMKRILGLVSLEVQKKHISVESSFAGDMPTIRTRTGELDQVFINIVNNAIDAMGDGGRLSVETRADSGRISVRISDTGKGIDPMVIGRIFEPFFTTRASRKGLGLGLSIAHDIVEKHGGKIEVESRPGGPTSFSVSIPTEGHSRG